MARQRKGKQALDALERYKGARNAGKTPILEGGMDYKQLGMSNQDAEWLASRRFTIEDIARMFNVSPIFLQEYSNSTYSNFSEASRAFLTMTMRPWLANFEQQIKSALLVALLFREFAIRWSLTLPIFSVPPQPNVTPLMSAVSRTGL
jgi:HK97 family phage portal protein